MSEQAKNTYNTIFFITKLKIEDLTAKNSINI